MAKTRSLSVVITGDAKDLNRAFGSVDKYADHTEGRLKRFGHNAAKSFAVAGAAASGALVVGLGKSVDAAVESEKSQVKLQAQLKASGVSYANHAKEIDKSIQATSRLSGLDDEDLQDSFTNIIRVTGNVSESLKLNGLAADIARAKHIDVAKAGQLVAKAYDGNVGALKRYGVSIEPVTKAQDKLKETHKHATAEQVRAAKESDKTATAQKALAAAQKTFSGQADAYGKTTAGSLDRMHVSSENLGEAIGKKLTPFLTIVADKVAKFVDQMQSGKGAGGDFVDAINDVTDAIRPIVKFFRDHPKLIAIAVAAWATYKTASLIALTSIKVQNFRKAFGIGKGAAAVEGAAAGRTYAGAFDASSAAGVKGAAKGGKLRGAMGVAGRGLGILMGAEIGVEVAKTLEATLKDKLPGGDKSHPNRPDGTPGTGWNLWDALGLGDGIGKPNADTMLSKIGLGTPSSALGGAFGNGGLDGARTSMAPFAALGSQYGLHLTAGRNHHSKRTASGNLSYHGSGEAIDEAGPIGKMRAYATMLYSKYGGRLAELISPWPNLGIKDGHPFHYDAATQAQHSGGNAHVHVAFDSGIRGIGDGLGKFDATSYGPPWGGIQGGGTTATGVDLHGSPHKYGVAVDPSVIPLGSMLRITPNPFNYGGLFEAFDTGGAIKGKRLDFYDWRGRAAQNGWGHRSVTVSMGSEGGSHGTKSGGSKSRPHTTVGTAGPSTGSLGGLGGVTTGQELSDVGLAKASAQAHDNLPAMIAALSTEKAIKRKRMHKIKRALKRRLKAATRARLTDELTQLVTDIAEINSLLKEYKADAAGGAKTLTEADALQAGRTPAQVDAAENPATATDFANAAIAEASLTPGLQDDITETESLLGIAQGDLDAARVSGDPRRIAAAIDAWKSVKASLDALKESVDAAKVAQQQHDDLMTEFVANQKKILAMVTQGPAIMAALVAAVNSGIGGQVGLGFQSVGYAGQVARS